MEQATDSESENRAWLSPVLQEARRFRGMNIHEHASLVQAIMLNFPEIYEEPIASSLAELVNAAHPAETAPPQPDSPGPGSPSPGFPSAEPS